MNLRRVLIDGLQVIIAAMVTVLFLVWAVFGSQTIATQNQDIAKAVQAELRTLAQSSSERACASTELLAFIIRTSDKRAHRLHTGAYLSAAEKLRIQGFVDAACRSPAQS